MLKHSRIKDNPLTLQQFIHISNNKGQSLLCPQGLRWGNANVRWDRGPQVWFPGKHLSSVIQVWVTQRPSSGKSQWRKNGGGCPGCSSNPDSPNVLQMRQNVDTMVHWNRRNAAVIGNSDAGLLRKDSAERGRSWRHSVDLLNYESGEEHKMLPA